jgi:GGDEF domain-containing protein/CHASE3 domain sensor protein
MKMLRLTVAQKIAAGYLLVILFCVGAAVYALVALGNQNQKSERLVTVDFEAWEKFREIPVDAGPALDQGLVAEFRRAGNRSRALLEEERWDGAQQLSREALSPTRDRLLGQIEQFLSRKDEDLNETLNALSRDSDRAYRVTLALVFLGIALAGLVASRLIFNLHRAVGTLARATREVAKGSFDYSVNLEADDEFGQLARDFSDMAEQLKELERLQLDANPLTQLPGNLAIERELQARLEAGRSFAHLYADLDHFKVYNDRYGYTAGSEVISAVGVLLKDTVRTHGNADDLVGHIGGDDYVVLSTPERAEAIAEDLIRDFDRMSPDFYAEEDRLVGHLVSEDRFGVERQFPLLTVSVAIVTSHNLKDACPAAIGRECAKIKEHLKRMEGSNYLMDRREMR